MEVWSAHSTFHRVESGLRTVGEPHLVQDASHVRPYCLLANEKVGADFLVRPTPCEAAQDLRARSTGPRKGSCRNSPDVVYRSQVL